LKAYLNIHSRKIFFELRTTSRLSEVL